MSIKTMTKSAGSGEAGGARRRAVLMSERRVVEVGHGFRADEVVRRPVLVVAMDLIAVARLEQVEEVRNEVVDLDDGIVAESRHWDVGGMVRVRWHGGDHRRAAVRRGAGASGWAKTSR